MIAARLVERIDIDADYSVSIRLRINMKQYTGEIAEREAKDREEYKALRGSFVFFSV